MPTLAVVIFSKDRPFQAACSLSSALRHICGTRLLISVLYKASTSCFEQSYAVVSRLLARSASAGGAGGSELHWERESADTPLGALLDRAVARAEAAKASGLLFTVDDALWLDVFQADLALALLRRDQNIYAVHAKLCPRVEYAHPNDKLMRVPRLHADAAAVEELSATCATACDAEASVGSQAAPLETHLLTYERSSGEYDWNYPWELSASVYRLEDVREMLSAIREHFGQEGVDHPNRLEGFGVRLFKQEKVKAATRTAKCACVSRPAVVVVTINRVQTLFDNPIYGQGGASDVSSPEASPEELDRSLRAGLRSLAADDAEAFARELHLSRAWLEAYWSLGGEALDLPIEDVAVHADAGSVEARSPWAGVVAQKLTALLLPEDAYRAAYLDSVHVPLLPPLPSLSAPCSLSDPPRISWLMPVRDAPSAWLRAAWTSICSQDGFGEGGELGTWELVVVDDASTAPETLELLTEWAALPQVRIVRFPERRGVASALNAGWRKCRGEFVARLDADDIAHRSRLRTQIPYLEAHPALSIVGGGFRTFRTEAELQSPKALHNARQYRMPCHPLLARWQMLFSCSLAHPTVTFRRADFPTGGVYPEDEEAEDHCCWLALPLHVHYANVADVVTYLRRHSGSRSASAAAAIKRSSFAGVRRFLARHCVGRDGQADEFTDEDCAVMWGSQQASSAEQARRVSRALDAMEALFLGLVDGHAEAGAEDILGGGFRADFVLARKSALRENISSSCSKLRGMVTVQSLAAGDVDSGVEMMKLLLKGGDGGLKSLGALINAGFSGQTER